MLGRDAKTLLRRFAQHEAVFQKVHLLYHLPGVSEELHAFFRQGDAAAASGEYLEPDFLLRRLQRRRQTRLGHVKPLCRLGDRTNLSHSDDVFQKLNGHYPALAKPQILTSRKPHPQSQTASRSPRQPQPQPAVGSITNPTHRHPVLRDRGCSPTPHNLRHRRPIQDSPMMEVTRPQNRIPHLHIRHK